MKKIKLILPILILALFMPFMVNAETCDINKITIDSITLEEKSDNVIELEEASANGKNINLNLSVSEVGDNIKYKITVKNDSNEDYELDNNIFNVSSDYIDYTLESEDDSNIIKANSSKIIYLKAEYKNQVQEDKFESGTFNDNKTMTVSLSTKNTINVPNTLKNPNTGDSLLFLCILILIISGVSFVILKKTKYVKFMILSIGFATIIPISVYALCKCEIKVESKVEIQSQYDYWCHIIYYNSSQYNLFKYKKGMTWREYYESEDPNIVKISDGCINGFYSCDNFNLIFSRKFDGTGMEIGLGPNYKYWPEGSNTDEDGNPYYINRKPNPDLKIVSKEEFCYGYIPD